MVSKALIRQLFSTQNPVLIQKLSEIIKVVSYRKRETVYKIGEQYAQFYVLLEGATCTYRYDEAQQQVATCFFSEEFDLMHTENFMRQAEVGMETVMDTTILEIPVKEAMALTEDFPELAWDYAKRLRKTMVYLCVLNNRRMYLSAEERYRWFCEKWPVVESHASNQQIASFLRMRPESLSRLKRQVKENKASHKNVSSILVTKDLKWDYMNIKEMMEKK